MLWQEFLVVDLDPFVHDFGMQSLVGELLNLAFGFAVLFVGKEWVLGAPGEDSRRWTLPDVSAHIESLVLLVHQCLLSVEVRIRFIHPGVATLAQSGVILVLFGGSSLRHFGLQVVLEFVQRVQSRVRLVSQRVFRFRVKKG